MSDNADPSPLVLRFELPGATPDQLAAGLAAAQHHLVYAGLDPSDGYRAFNARLAWLRCEGPEPSPLEIQNAMIFGTCLVSAIDASIGLEAPRPDGIQLILGPPIH